MGLRGHQGNHDVPLMGAGALQALHGTLAGKDTLPSPLPPPCNTFLLSFYAHEITVCNHLFIPHLPSDTMQGPGDTTRVKTDMAPS